MSVSASREDAWRADCKRWMRFSLRGLLFLLTLCAVFVGISTLFLPVLIEAVAVLACVELLMRNLPSTIRAAIAENTRRLDGTWSRRRERIEKRAQHKLRWNLIVVFVLLLVPGHVLLYGIHTYVIPLPVGLDAVAAFRLPLADWKQSLRDDGIEGRYEKWQDAPNGADTRTMKQLLWRSWPLVVGSCAVWIGLSFLALKSIYIAALRELAAEIQSRSEQYKLHDLARWRRGTGPEAHAS